MVKAVSQHDPRGSRLPRGMLALQKRA